MKYYTGIGSRKTPPKILRVMEAFSEVMHDKGYWLRSGGADGADQAFEHGAKGKKFIYVPWEDFNNRRDTIMGRFDLWGVSGEAMMIAMRHHPAWSSLTDGARKLHARNVYQVIGMEINNPHPSEFLICWTPDGCVSRETRSRETGGTGTAIAVAQTYGVPVLNLQRLDHLKKVVGMIKKHRDSKS